MFVNAPSLYLLLVKTVDIPAIITLVDRQSVRVCIQLALRVTVRCLGQGRLTALHREVVRVITGLGAHARVDDSNALKGSFAVHLRESIHHSNALSSREKFTREHGLVESRPETLAHRPILAGVQGASLHGRIMQRPVHAIASAALPRLVRALRALDEAVGVRTHDRAVSVNDVNAKRKLASLARTSCEPITLHQSNYEEG